MKISVFYDHITQAMAQTGQKLSVLLEEVKQDGIDGIEINYSQLATNKWKLMRAFKKAGLQISCIYEFYDWGNQVDLTKAKKHVKLAKKVGAGKILVIPGFLSEEEAEEINACCDSYDGTAAYMEKNPKIQNMKRALTELTAYARKKGVFVTLEDFDGKTAPFARMYQLKWFMEQVPDLKFTLDTGNFAYSDEDVEKAYELLKEYIVHVHCKDRGKEEDAEGVFCRGMGIVSVGEGYIPIKTLVEKELARHYDGYFAIEHFDAPDQMAYIKRSAAYLCECYSSVMH